MKISLKMLQENGYNYKLRREPFYLRYVLGVVALF
jgi:hypothetical protein